MKRQIDVNKPLNHYFTFSDQYADTPISRVERYANPDYLSATKRVLKILQSNQIHLLHQLLDCSYMELVSFRNLGEPSLNRFLVVLRLVYEDPDLLQQMEVEPSTPSLLVQLREQYEKRAEIPLEEIERRQKRESIKARLRALGVIL